jgi:hypothetical protein
MDLSQRPGEPCWSCRGANLRETDAYLGFLGAGCGVRPMKNVRPRPPGREGFPGTGAREPADEAAG